MQAYIVLHQRAWRYIKDFGKIKICICKRWSQTIEFYLTSLHANYVKTLAHCYWAVLFGSTFFFCCQTLTVPVVLSSSLGESQQTSRLCSETWNWRVFILFSVYKSTPFLKSIFKLKRSPYMPWHTVVLQRRYILISLSEVYEGCQTTVGSTKIVCRGVASKNIPTKGMDPKCIHLSKNR